MLSVSHGGSSWMYGTQGQDARVKLCGREFIRMVVTSCGSSRPWTTPQDQFRDDQQSTESVTEDQQNHLGFPNVGPAGVCCRSGCNMSELLQYC
uniref:Insulin-like 3 n=1 Tax=Hucho hucho TaxID=62062 RepID=A0A4W5K4Z3_9TELE